MDKKTLAKQLNLNLEDLNQRLDGRIEWVCKHGVGHTIFAPKSMGDSGYIHGCDGCCKEIKEEEK